MSMLATSIVRQTFSKIEEHALSETAITMLWNRLTSVLSKDENAPLSANEVC